VYQPAPYVQLTPSYQFPPARLSLSVHDYAVAALIGVHESLNTETQSAMKSARVFADERSLRGVTLLDTDFGYRPRYALIDYSNYGDPRHSMHDYAQRNPIRSGVPRRPGRIMIVTNCHLDDYAGDEGGGMRKFIEGDV